MESPEVGIICGSGLSGLSNALEGKTLTVSNVIAHNNSPTTNLRLQLPRIFSFPEPLLFSHRSTTAKYLAFLLKRLSSDTKERSSSGSYLGLLPSVFVDDSTVTKDTL
jgi:hypothetical protein